MMVLESYPVGLELYPLRFRIEREDKLSIEDIAALEYMNGEPEKFEDSDIIKIKSRMYAVKFYNVEKFLCPNKKQELINKLKEESKEEREIYAAINKNILVYMSQAPDDTVVMG